jgi:glutamine phosphoribosylpyrophosphate amidotransferase
VNAQPIVQHGAVRTVAVGHNGNLVNASELRGGLDVKLSSTSDTELIAALIANDPQPLRDAVASTMQRLEGAYSVTALAEGKLLAFRDPHGFRPLVLGRLSDGWVVASETCALDLVGADFEREIAPGELLIVDESGVESLQASTARPARSASSSSSTSRGPTPGSRASRCTARACGWASARRGGAGRGRPRPARSPTRAPRRRSASRARPASRSARA